MRPDKRYGAFLILSIVFLAVFVLSSSRYSIRRAVAAGNASVSGNPAPESPFGNAVLENGKAKPATLKGVFPAFPIDINTAGEEELRLLPGVGEKTAERIIEKRKELGGFHTVDELLKVKWIGKAKLARIRGLVTINGGHREEAAPEGG